MAASDSAYAGLSPLDRLYSILSGEDASERACEAIPDAACTDVPRNFVLNAANGACTKLAEQLASPGLVIPWILSALGAPAVLIGYPEPLKQTGSLLPQMAVAARIRAAARRKYFWVAAGLFQAVMLALMIPAALFLPPLAGALSILILLLLFSMASGVGSVAFQDVMGKTIPKGRRGRLLSARAAIGGALTLVAGGYLRFAVPEDAALASLMLLVGAAAILWALGAGFFAMIEERPGASEGGRNMLSEAARGFHKMKRVAPFRTFLGARALLLVIELATPFFALHAQSLYGNAVEGLAMFILAMGLANVISSPFWGRFSDAAAAKVMMVSGLLAALAAAAALWLARIPALGDAPWVYALVFVVLGLAIAGVRLGRKTYLVDAVPKDDRPLYVAFSNTAIGALALVMGALGVIAQMFNADVLIAVIGLLALLGALVARRLPAPEAFERADAEAG